MTRMIISIVLMFITFPSIPAFGQQAVIDKLFNLFKKQRDSLKVVEKNPLESYFFDDSLRNKKIFAWTAELDINRVDTVTVDTLLNRFEIDYPFMEEYVVGATYLGNLGGAAQSLSYFERPRSNDFVFLRAYDSYLVDPQSTRFFNVKEPFTQLSWFMSGQTRRAEEQLRVTHAQNISPSTGFNIDYKNRGTKGMYSSQRSKDKNLSFGISHTGKKYSLHAGYDYNMGDIRENGGIMRDEDVTDTIYSLPYNIEVKLTDARNQFKGNTFFISQAYGIPLQKVYLEDFSIADKSSIFVGHYFEYTRFRKKYTDTKANSTDFYDDWFLNPTATSDSLSETKIDNKIFIQLQPWDRNAVIGTIDAGIGHAMYSYYMFRLKNYLRGNKNTKRNDTYVYGSLTGRIKQYIDWRADVTYHPFGDKSQDLNLNAELKMSVFIKNRPLSLTVSGFIDNRSPGYWDEKYFSNHFIWSNDFSKETETNISAKLEAAAIGFEAGAWQSVVTDKIYYNKYALPAQHGGTVSVTGLYVRKDSHIGIFHFNHRALLQWSSNEDVVPLPLVSAYATYFIDFYLVRNVLRMQLGVDAWYNTEYYAPSYIPATMQFYNQDEIKTGNYLFMDAFLSAKWKRMRILVKFQHVNEDLFGKRNYFSVPHYPLNRRMFKLGFSWSFYD
ncbi:MAG: putative porin [Rikenellaceae bacterium]|nr:putative porin [Rikenellaceae bacterium]